MSNNDLLKVTELVYNFLLNQATRELRMIAESSTSESPIVMTHRNDDKATIFFAAKQDAHNNVVPTSLGKLDPLAELTFTREKTENNSSAETINVEDGALLNQAEIEKLLYHSAAIPTNKALQFYARRLSGMEALILAPMDSLSELPFTKQDFINLYTTIDDGTPARLLSIVPNEIDVARNRRKRNPNRRYPKYIEEEPIRIDKLVNSMTFAYKYIRAEKQYVIETLTSGGDSKKGRAKLLSALERLYREYFASDKLIGKTVYVKDVPYPFTIMKLIDTFEDFFNGYVNI